MNNIIFCKLSVFFFNVETKNLHPDVTEAARVSDGFRPDGTRERSRFIKGGCSGNRV